MRAFERVIGEARLVPVLRESDAEAVIKRGRLLLDGGWPLIEIAATTPGWVTALAELRRSFPSCVIGVGTVLDAKTCRLAGNLGADFLVCPHLDQDLAEAAPNLVIQGGFTPGEVYAACQHGLGKLFPCHVLSPTYLVSLLAVYPGLMVMPTGGLSVAGAIPWLEAGAFAVGIGSSLFLEDDPLAAMRVALETVARH